MTAFSYSIASRNKSASLATASMRDFELEDERTVAADEVLNTETITPYCVDAETGRMVLVETPSTLDLSAQPFFYSTQYQYATRVFSIGLDLFNAACDRMTDPQRLLLIHSTGRCGSTLLINALNEVPEVSAISEPDVFTQLSMAGGHTDRELRAALKRTYRSCIRLLCRSPHALHAIKFRSIVCEHSDLLSEAMPAALQLFVYRNAVDVAASTARIIGHDPSTWILDQTQRNGWLSLAPLLASIDAPLNAYDVYAALWAGPVLRYIERRKESAWIGALRYEDLATNRGRTIEELLVRCGFERNGPIACFDAFLRDSQAGTHLALDTINPHSALSDKIASPEFGRRLRDSLHRIDGALVPDMLLPGTFGMKAEAW